MSRFILSVCLVLAPLPAAAQSIPPPTGMWSPWGGPSGEAGHALKGALIGAGVGAAAGLGFASASCDGSHCDTSGYAGAAILFGAMGSAIGGVIGFGIDVSHRRAKAHPSSQPAITISPMISPDVRGGRVALRF